MTGTDKSLAARIRSEYRLVRERGLRASAGRSFEIVAVTKTLPVETILAGYEAGIRDFGENYADELIGKASNPSLVFADDPIRWHFIGAIQSRKVAGLAEHVSVWHSVCREKEIERIARASPGAEIFVQVNFSDAEQRNGVRLPEAAGLVNLGIERGLKVLGLMVVPPMVEQALLGEIFTAVNEERLRLGLECCSMGMSDDYELALSKGSTHIRVGSAIFGKRSSSATLGSKSNQGGPS